MQQHSVRLTAGFFIAVLIASACNGFPGGGSNYPTQPITLIVPFAAGGASDLIARELASEAKLAKPIVVVNREGGGGAVGVNEVIHVQPDGYEIGFGFAPILTLQPHKTADLPFKGPGEVTPVIHLVQGTAVLAVRTDESWKTAQELLAAAKASPGTIKVGTDSGGPPDLAIETLKSRGTGLGHVKFNGGAETLTNFLGGSVQAELGNLAELDPQVAAGKIRLLAVLGDKRIPKYSDVPTFKDLSLGYSVTQGEAYDFIFVPKGTPDGVVKTLHDAFKTIVEGQQFKTFAEKYYFVVDYKNGADTKAALERDFTYWAGALKQ